MTTPLIPGIESFAGNHIGIFEIDKDTIEIVILNDINKRSVIVKPERCTNEHYIKIVAFCSGLVNAEDICDY